MQKVSKMSETEITKINNYNDFKEKLQHIKESEVAMVLSFYKYCYENDDEIDFETAKELMEEELESLGIKPYKITKDLDLIFKYKRKAEAIIHIKPYKIDLLIHKK